MDINSFLQALYISAMIVSLAGVLTEAFLSNRTTGKYDCDHLHWVPVLMCLIPVVNIILAVCVWAAIIVGDNNPPSPPTEHVACAC